MDGIESINHCVGRCLAFPKGLRKYVFNRLGQSMEGKEWGCSPHFPGVVHRPGEITEVVAERRITSEAGCMKSGGGERVGIGQHVPGRTTEDQCALW